MSSQAQDADAWPGPAAEGGRGPAVELDEVVKSFGATRALRGVTLAVERGTIHALVGENGAGKSTCLGVIAGRVSPDRGVLRVMGERGWARDRVMRKQDNRCSVPAERRIR
jgi:ABC-type sugar transport system ATPase subunit